MKTEALREILGKDLRVHCKGDEEEEEEEEGRRRRGRRRKEGRK